MIFTTWGLLAWLAWAALPAGAGRVSVESILSSPPLAASGGSLLAPVVAKLQAAVVWGPSGEVQQVKRDTFLEGLELLEEGPLDAFGQELADYLRTLLKTHTEMMRKSSTGARGARDDYRLWLLGELPMHAGKKSYAPVSAWMGNLWVGWTLQLFVEFSRRFVQGQDTVASLKEAYGVVLSHRVQFVGRKAFRSVVESMPNRTAFVSALRGTGNAKDDSVEGDVRAFVKVAWALAEHCFSVDRELEALQHSGSKKVTPRKTVVFKLASDLSKCLRPPEGSPDGNLEVHKCDDGHGFRFWAPESGSGLISMVAYPERCIRAEPTWTTWDHVQIWGCSDEDAFQFAVPVGGLGPIRLHKDNNKCLSVGAGAPGDVRMQGCGSSGDLDFVVSDVAEQPHSEVDFNVRPHEQAAEIEAMV